MIVIAGRVTVKPERREEAIRVARTMVAATRREPGCRAYGFHADLEDPNVFFVFEEWQDEQSLARHFQTDHMATFRRHLPDLLAKPPALTRYAVAATLPM